MTDDTTRNNHRMNVAIGGADGLLSINEAIRRGFSKLRLDKWSNPDDYMEFYIFEHPTGEKSPGPWVKLWSPANELVDMKNPQTLLITMLGDLDDPCWRPLPKTLERK